MVACDENLKGHFYARDYYTRSIIIDKIRRSEWHTRTKGVGCRLFDDDETRGALMNFSVDPIGIAATGRYNFLVSTFLQRKSVS